MDNPENEKFNQEWGVVLLCRLGCNLYVKVIPAFSQMYDYVALIIQSTQCA
jgi:hypothetical protein